MQIMRNASVKARVVDCLIGFRYIKPAASAADSPSSPGRAVISSRYDIGRVKGRKLLTRRIW